MAHRDDDEGSRPKSGAEGAARHEDAIEVSLSQIEPLDPAAATIAQPVPARVVPHVVLPDRAGEVLGGRYVLLRLIARGGMGAVYAATQRPFDREVAIKILTHAPHDEEYRRRFFREGSVLANMSHPHVVTVFDYGETAQGELYLAMELLRGETLSKLLQRQKVLPLPRALTIAVQLARALRVAHRFGVVHRDLKPANVMLLSEGEGEGEPVDFAKVLDFGLAKPFVEVGAGSDELTHSGMWLGSPRYMSPEQIRCEAVGPATDIYALGAIMFNMLAGRAPYIGSTSAELFGQHLYEPVPKLAQLAPDTPPDVAALVESCLAKRAEDRPPSMDAVIAQIRAHGPVGGVTSEIPVGTLLPSSAPRPAPSSSDGPTPTPSAMAPVALFSEPVASPPRPPPLSSRRALIAAVVVVFAAGLAFGFWALGEDAPPAGPLADERAPAGSAPLGAVAPAADPAPAATSPKVLEAAAPSAAASPSASTSPDSPPGEADAPEAITPAPTTHDPVRSRPSAASPSRAPAAAPVREVAASPRAAPTPTVEAPAPPLPDPSVPAAQPRRPEASARPDAGRPALDLDTVPLLD